MMTLRTALLWPALAVSLLAGVPAAAQSNHVFYTVEKVRWGTSDHSLALPRTFSSSPDMTASALASEAFHRLKSYRGSAYADASLTLDPNFSATGAASVTLGEAATAELAAVVSEVFWTLSSAGVKEIRIPEVSKDALAAADVPYGAASLVVQLWQILPPGQPGPGHVRVGGEVMLAFEARRKLDARDKALTAAVLELLKSPLAFVRMKAIEAVAQLNLPRAEDALVPLLEDPDPKVKAAVVKGFSGTKSRKVLGALEKLVQSDADPSVQSAAARILSDAGIKKYEVVVLYDKLNDPDEAVVMDAVDKLSKEGKPDVAVALVEVMTHKSSQIRDMAMKAIVDLNNPDALRKVVETEQVAGKYKAQAARQLAATDGEDGDRGLRYLVVHGSAEDRVWAINEVAKRRRYKVVTDVIGALSHEDPAVRTAAAGALAEIKDSKALAPLSEALGKHEGQKEEFEKAIIAIFGGLSQDEVIRFSTSEDKTLRQLAIKSLARFAADGRPSPRILAVLKERLSDSDADIKRSAAFALARINDPSVIDALIGLKDDSDGTIREQVAVALASSNHPQANELLLKYLEDTHPPVKRAAADGLRERKVTDAIQKLKFQARGRDAEVRSAVMHALVELSTDEQWDELFPIYSQALFDQEPEVKIWAVRGLARRKDARIPGLLSPLVRDPSDPVKVAALKALGASGDPAAVEYITTGLLEAKDSEVKLAALDALEQLNLDAAKKPIQEFVKNEQDPKLRERANEVYDNLP